MVADAPLHVTRDTPDRVSLSEPMTVMDVALRLIVCPLAGDKIIRLGGVLSRLIVTEVLAALPALSMPVPEIV